MSLTFELKNNLELKSLIESSLKHNNIIISNRKNIKYELIGSYNEAALVGTSYDYLLRLNISKKNHMNINNTINSLIAIQVYEYLVSIKKDLILKDNFNIAIKNITLFLDNKIISDEDLICSVIYLSFLDYIYRNGDFKYINMINKFEEIKVKFNNVYKDLINLNNSLKNLKKEFYGKKILLNPSFSNSKLLGGADADLIIDNNLIDIKTIVNATINSEMLSQLIGYMILAEFDNIKIENIGIYFSRYEELKLINKYDILEKEDEEKIKKYFRSYYGFKENFSRK